MWPVMDEEDRQALLTEAIKAERALDTIARCVTVYPSGGIPATQAREAMALVTEIQNWLRP